MKLFYLALLSQISLAEPIKITTFEYEPFINESHDGLLQEQLNRVSNNAEIEYKVLPIARAMENFKTNKGFFLGTINQFKKSTSNNLEQVHLEKLNTYLYSKRTSKGRILKIGTLLGNDGELRLVQMIPNAKSIKVKSTKQALLMLNSGRLDGFFCIDKTCDQIIRNNKLLNIKKSSRIYKRLSVGIIYYKNAITEKERLFLNSLRNTYNEND